MVIVQHICLQSDLVVLENYAVEDAPQLFEAISTSVERIYPWLPWCHPNYTIAETEAWLEIRPQHWDAGKEFGFSIRDSQDRIVGGIGIGISSLSWSSYLGY